VTGRRVAVLVVIIAVASAFWFAVSHAPREPGPTSPSTTMATTTTEGAELIPPVVVTRG
jgi:hypothetical protein